jgi:hypothetical protein
VLFVLEPAQEGATKSCTGITMRSLRQLLGAVFRHYGPLQIPISLRARGRSANANAFWPHDFPPAWTMNWIHAAAMTLRNAAG